MTPYLAVALWVAVLVALRWAALGGPAMGWLEIEVDVLPTKPPPKPRDAGRSARPPGEWMTPPRRSKADALIAARERAKQQAALRRMEEIAPGRWASEEGAEFVEYYDGARGEYRRLRSR